MTKRLLKDAKEWGWDTATKARSSHRYTLMRNRMAKMMSDIEDYLVGFPKIKALQKRISQRIDTDYAKDVAYFEKQIDIPKYIN